LGALFVTLLAVLTALTAWSGRAPAAEMEGADVVFDCYRHYGHYIAGFFVDREGYVYEYRADGGGDLSEWDLGGSGKAISSRVFTSSALHRKIRDRRLRMSVTAPDLAEKRLKISSAGRGTVTRRPGKGTGWKGCLAYTHDQETGSYRAINLGAEGRYIERNSSADARRLRSWLEEFWAPQAIPTGRFLNEHTVYFYGGETGEPMEETAIDTLEIQNTDDERYRFSFMLIFSNGHTCDMRGTATVRDGGLEYKTVYEDFYDSPAACLLRIDFGKVITLHASQACRDMNCGMRGVIDGATFPGKPRIE
jgi:hypothetical protein